MCTCIPYTWNSFKAGVWSGRIYFLRFTKYKLHQISGIFDVIKDLGNFFQCQELEKTASSYAERTLLSLKHIGKVYVITK